jgi:hypothetical protein
MNWQDAMDLAFQLGLMDNYGNTYIYNGDFREGRTQRCRTAGSILIDGGGMYTVTNASTTAEITDLDEDEVDDALEDLGVADDDWNILFPDEYER